VRVAPVLVEDRHERPQLEAAQAPDDAARAVLRARRARGSASARARAQEERGEGEQGESAHLALVAVDQHRVVARVEDGRQGADDLVLGDRDERLLVARNAELEEPAQREEEERRSGRGKGARGGEGRRGGEGGEAGEREKAVSGCPSGSSARSNVLMCTHTKRSGGANS